MSRGYEAVVFDFFGTLTRACRRGPRHRLVARALGCDPAEFTTVLDRSYHARVCGEYGSVRETLRALSHQLGRRPGEEQLDRAVRLRFAALRADIRLRPEAMSTLWTLRERGLRTAVMSDCGSELPQLMPELPIAGLLDVAIYSCQLGVRKPHPRMYATACRLLNADPATCVYIGDGGGRELSGARAAGLTAIQLTAADLVHHLHIDTEQDWPGPSTASLSGLPDLVRPLEAGRMDPAHGCRGTALCTGGDEHGRRGTTRP